MKKTKWEVEKKIECLGKELFYIVRIWSNGLGERKLIDETQFKEYGINQ